MEKEPKFLILPPQEGDEIAIGKIHLQSWQESYRDDEHGITEKVINDLRGDTATEGGNEIRRKIFAESRETPNRVLYRVVKTDVGEIVGFMHCIKNEVKNELMAIYLLNEAKGAGTGGRLMEEFLTWADKDKPAVLRVFSANEM